MFKALFLILALLYSPFGEASLYSVSKCSFLFGDTGNGPNGKKDSIKPDRQDVLDAQVRVKEFIQEPTRLVYNQELSKAYGLDVYFKLESDLPIKAFKLRGALNRLLQLTPEQMSRGVVTASSGNHAQGVALGAKYLGIEATVVMPVSADPVKVKNTAKRGAQVVLYGETFDQAKQKAYELEKESGAVFIPPFRDKQVIAGQGTIGLEILKQLPEVQWVIGAVGGGGLMGGISTALGGAGVKTIGVQAKNASPIFKDLVGREQSTENLPTLAEGAAVYTKSDKMVSLLKERLDYISSVSEKQIEEAVLAFDKMGYRVEGAGALPLAALTRNLSEIKSKTPGRAKVVLVVSGGNISTSKLESLRQK